MKKIERLTKNGRKLSRRTKPGTKTKACTSCGKRKDRDKFVTGRMCKDCKNAYDKKRYLEKKDEIDSRMREYGKSERGREVNRAASTKYIKGGRGAVKSKAWYETMRQDPIQYTEYLRRKRANGKVAYAIKTGKLVQGPCEVCGSTGVYAHHEDYDKPLEVRWLCTLHHGVTRRKE